MNRSLVVSLFLLVLLGSVPFSAKAKVHILSTDTLTVSDSMQIRMAGEVLTLGLGEDHQTKIVSALFAFPFPFGFMGAHRVMLGTKPWIPVVYVATFGGCFGILPLIDFCAILLSKDLSEYENNPHVFMWIKQSE